MLQSCAPIKRNAVLVSCLKTVGDTTANKSDGVKVEGSLEKKNPRRAATFPGGFEALVLEVCDQTEVAELKLKVGDFEMHLKRNIESASTSVPNTTIETQLPVQAKTVNISPPPPLLPPPPSSAKSEKAAPFINASFGKSSRLEALEASGANGFAVVNSSKVGIFHRGRLVKGRRLPPVFKEGDLIKEGQVIGYVDQLGSEEPMRSDVTGEVLKLLVDEGDSVGYGDPVIAVLPSFHGIQ